MKVTVLGVPSSVSAYCIGVERAPAALRAAGLVDALRVGGHEVVDAGDLTTRSWAQDREHRYAQNIDQEVEAMPELSAAAAGLLTEGSRLLVLGGSCTVAVGLCDAVARLGGRPRLVYVDRHLDLNTPQSTTEGSLSWMGMAHALALDGAERPLLDAMTCTPLLDPSELAYLGVDDTQATEWERAQVRALDITVVSQADLTADSQHAARAAQGALSAGPFVVHLDVDVLDFIDAPIAENVNGRNSGPTIAQLEPALRELWQHPDCLAVSVGQLVPAHAAADPTALPRLIDMLVSAAA